MDAIAMKSPFHEGEQAVQRRMGVREAIEPFARQVVRPYFPQQHRDFYSQLPFLVAAARDGQDRPWVTLLAGKPGFVRSPDDRSLQIDARPLPGDALEQTLVAGADLGLLGIELETRRRNRVNGTLALAGPGGMTFAVSQTFGNCPQYITEREWQWQDPGSPAPAWVGSALEERDQRWINTADTFFIASGYQRSDGASSVYGMDASHRGGAPGFVRVNSSTRLVFPDYAGNNHFNTIGNLTVDPRVGLLFVDFDRGSLLQLTGRARIDWDSPAVADHPGAQRLVIVDVEQVVRLDSALPLRWKEPRGAIRSLRLVRKIRESADVTSFEFVARDGGDLPEFRAGQHLPLELRLDGLDQPVSRTYSLSGSPEDPHYRISVKREPRGLISRHLHDQLEPGAIISARQPNGDFVLQPGPRPVVLISAGVGVTPMVSMLHQLARDGFRNPVHFIHGARDSDHHPLAREVHELIEGQANARRTVVFSRPRPRDREGYDFDLPGRLDGDLLAQVLPDFSADFYLCGPSAFMAELSAALQAREVPQDAIHMETF